MPTVRSAANAVSECRVNVTSVCPFWLQISQALDPSGRSVSDRQPDQQQRSAFDHVVVIAKARRRSLGQSARRHRSLRSR